MRRFLNGIILLLLGLSVATAVCMVLMLLQENGLIHWAWVAEVDAWFSQTSHAVGFCLALWGSLILFRLIDRGWTACRRRMAAAAQTVFLLRS